MAKPKPRYVDVEEARQRECVYCGADIGEPCVTANGTVMQTTHFARDPEEDARPCPQLGCGRVHESQMDYDEAHHPTEEI